MRLPKIKKSDGADVNATVSSLVQLLLAELSSPVGLSLTLCEDNPSTISWVL